MGTDAEKQLAAQAGARLVDDRMRVGLGSGTTVAFLLTELARRGSAARFVATSPRTERSARDLGLAIEEFDTWDRLDLAIDGADQISAAGWLIKGGGGAHTREKIVANVADRFVVIVDSSKEVSALHPPVPLELMTFGLAATLAELGTAKLRGVEASLDGGVIADLFGEVGDPAALARRLDAHPGVVAHGLFSPDLVDEMIVGVGTTIRHVTTGGPP
ncbi:MAG TPA: ribose 5-phosphate isomerase A [Acidimicrobiales bacterium]|nr:ribose 5-phosphate isomerase A [Acidimicrobiales bacterium]